MAKAMREATEATRDINNAVINIEDPYIEITFTGGIPFAVDKLVREKNWMIDPTSNESEGLIIFK